MSIDAKKHTTIAAGETPSRAGLAAAILSINDVIPVANATEANVVAAAVVATGQNLATTPVVVSRADARGLHRIEISYNGTTWLPASGSLSFATTSARDTWTTTNSSYLTAGDECWVGSVQYRWTGSVWAARAMLAPWGSDTPAAVSPLFKSGRASGTTSGTGVLTYTFPTAFPGGVAAVSLMPTQNGGADTVLVEASVTATGFQTLWPGMASVAVAINFLAVGY